MTTAGISRRRYAIVTGGGSGLGREICRVLAEDGYHVAIVGVKRPSLDETLQLVESVGATGQVEICDVTDRRAWSLLGERLRAAWPRLDLLVNNAGMFSSGFVGRLDLAEVERVVRLNLFGVLYGCDAMVPWLIECARQSTGVDRPALVNISSIYAYLNPPGMAPYNISKAGIVSLSETLAAELRHQGVGVIVACPGPMPTRFLEKAHFESAAFRRVTEKSVRKSTLQPREVATAIRQAVHRHQLYCVVGSRERWYWRCKRWFPTMVLKTVARRVLRDLKAAAQAEGGF
jgi:NAD(P)-dependent dehydrogenase (short-subunit alcohol dehydrogenase family)